MALNVGELQATLKINTRDFQRGIEDAKGEIEDLSDSISLDITQSADKAADSFEELTETTDKTTEATTDYGKAIQDAGNKSKQASSQVEDVTKKTKASGEQATTAKEMFSMFKGVLGALGVGFSVSAIIKGLQSIIDKITESIKQVEDLDTAIQYMTGGNAVLTERLQALVYPIAYDLPVQNINDIGTALATVSSFDGNATDEQLKTITEELLALKLIIPSLNVETTGMKLNETFRKWGVGVDEYATKLAELRTVSANTRIGFDELVSSLSDIDDLQDYLGMTVDDILKTINGMKPEEFRDFVDGADDLGTMYSQTLSKTVNEKMAEGMTYIEASKIGKEYVDGIFQGAMEESAKYGNIIEATGVWARLGFSSKVATPLAKMSDAYVNSNGEGIGQVTSIVEQAKTNGGWTETQEKWMQENLTTLQASQTEMAKYTKDISERTTEAVKEGYIFDPDYKATNDAQKEALQDLREAAVGANGMVGLLTTIATLPVDLKTSVDSIISEIGKVDPPVVNVNVKTTDPNPSVSIDQQAKALGMGAAL